MTVKKNRLNKFFAGLIIILLLGMIGISIYFQIIVEDLNSENEFLADRLKLTTGELYETMDELVRMNNTAQSLNLNLESYTNEFQDVYQICEGENSGLNNELISTRSSLLKSQNKTLELEGDIDAIKVTLLGLKANFITINDRFDDLDDEISRISRYSNNIEDIVEVAYDSNQLNEVKSYVLDIDDENDDLQNQISDVRSASGSTQNGVGDLEIALDAAIKTVVK